MCDPFIAPRPGLWFLQEQKAWRMGGHTGNGDRCGLCRTGGLLPSEEQAEERILPQEAGGGIPDRSGHVTHLSAYNCWSNLLAHLCRNNFFLFFFFLVLRLDNGEPLDFGQVAYYNSGLQEDNIQMSKIPAHYWHQHQNLLPIMFSAHTLDKVLLFVKTTSRQWRLWVQVKNTLMQIHFTAKDLSIYSIRTVDRSGAAVRNPRQAAKTNCQTLRTLPNGIKSFSVPNEGSAGPRCLFKKVNVCCSFNRKQRIRSAEEEKQMKTFFSFLIVIL